MTGEPVDVHEQQAKEKEKKEKVEKAVREKVVEAAEQLGISEPALRMARQQIAFYGSSLLSSYWNGAATYYRGIIRALHRLG